MTALKYTLFVFLSLQILCAQEIGSFAIKREITSTKLVFPDKIIINRYDDPKVKGVACFVSSVEIGGVKGVVGLAVDPSDASVSCVRIGKIEIGKISESPSGEVVYSENQSLFFKTLQVRRIYDKTTNTLVYVSYSDRILDGSYKNTISVVHIE